MPVNSTHAQYAERTNDWALIRTILAGERAVKAKGENLLPRPEGMSDDGYDAYKGRASFFNATSRTADGYLGLLFRRSPQIDRFEQPLYRDFDLAGTSIVSYARHVCEEVIATGRCGTLVDYSASRKRAYANFYAAEDVINWRYETVDGKRRLSLLVLREAVEEMGADDPFLPQRIEQFRVLTMVDNALRVEVHRPVKDGWSVQSFAPKQAGKSLTAIPFFFHCSNADTTRIPRPPLLDLAGMNLDHYRMTADYRTAMHFVTMPIVFLAGFDLNAETLPKTTTLTDKATFTGPKAITATDASATAQFLEYKGQGLNAFELALDRCERALAMLGSRLLEPRKNVGETAEAIELRQSGESSILRAMALNISESLSDAAAAVQLWGVVSISGPAVVPTVEINVDFGTKGLTAQQLTATVEAWQSGALKEEEMRDYLRRVELLPVNPIKVPGEPAA